MPLNPPAVVASLPLSMPESIMYFIMRLAPLRPLTPLRPNTETILPNR